MMSSSHLFLGLPIALFVLYLELNSAFHSAAFFSHLSLGEFAIRSAQFPFHFLCVLFQHRIFACSILSNASAVLLFMSSIHSSSSIVVVSISSSGSFQMSLYCRRHPEFLCSGRLRFHHQCYTFHCCQLLHFLLWAQYLVSQSFCISFFVWMMNRSILRCVD